MRNRTDGTTCSRRARGEKEARVGEIGRGGRVPPHGKKIQYIILNNIFKLGEGGEEGTPLALEGTLRCAGNWRPTLSAASNATHSATPNRTLTKQFVRFMTLMMHWGLRRILEDHIGCCETRRRCTERMKRPRSDRSSIRY